MGEDERGAFLVWGDPALYDSTIRILQAIRASGACAFEFEVIPGITSAQLLTARHQVPLNEIGHPLIDGREHRVRGLVQRVVDRPVGSATVVRLVDARPRAA